MYKLPKHFTGYDAVPLISLEEFKSLCYSLQGLGLISVHKIEGYKYPGNYYIAYVADRDGEFFIYINCFAAIMAFGIMSDTSEIYIEKPDLINAIKSLQFSVEVLLPTILKQEVTRESLTDLSNAEISAVKNWLPCSTGRMLFSTFFD